MKSPVLGTFLVGVACGIGLTVLSLYAQKPGCFITAADTIAEMGRARRDKKGENKFLRKRLEAMGFSTKEINENL
jgi:ubiquinone/menaquinone biosynthesis C-methylase UbiE